MNTFIETFGPRIRDFWGRLSELEKTDLLAEIRQYANASPATFKSELNAVLFDDRLMALPIAMEALAPDAGTWGDWYVEIVDKILETAPTVAKPWSVLHNLGDLVYIEKQHLPFVQQIADRLHTEANSSFLPVKLAAIHALAEILDNTYLQNRQRMKETLQQKLQDDNWKVRYVAYKALYYEELLPEGARLAFKDRLRKWIFGAPRTV